MCEKYLSVGEGFKATRISQMNTTIVVELTDIFHSTIIFTNDNNEIRKPDHFFFLWNYNKKKKEIKIGRVIIKPGLVGFGKTSAYINLATEIPLF